MIYRIELIPPARAEIRALPGSVRFQALELIAALGDEPRPPRAKELNPPVATLHVGSELYRIWLAGRWRIAYEVDAVTCRVLVLCLRRKEDSDYDSFPSWFTESGEHFLPIDGVGANPGSLRSKARGSNDRDRDRDR